MESSLAVGLIFALCACVLIWVWDSRSTPSKIVEAVINEDLQTLKSMLGNSTSAEKQEALFVAIFHKCDAALDLVLEAGPSLTQPLQWDGAALHIAARYGTPHALNRLLTLGAEVNQDCRGTPLYWAADAGRDDFVNRLIESGSNVDAVDLDMLGKSGFKPNFNTSEDYHRIASTIRNAKQAM